MMIDIRGGSTRNKGAELMLRAAAQRLGAAHRLTAPPVRIDFDVACDLRLHRTLPVHRSPRVSAWASNAVPRSVRDRFAVVADEDISAVVNIAGYAYGDPFLVRNCKLEGERVERWRRRDVPTILMPQAFGPFSTPEYVAAAKRLLSASSLVFARDRRSLEFVQSVTSDHPGVRLAPDFTISLEALPVPAPTPGEYGAIVPNMKLIETGVHTRPEYVALLTQIGSSISEAGLEPLVVVHETNDVDLATEVASRLDCRVYSDPHPLRLKGVLGGATVVAGSRFHAIVGALSSGVPTLVVGWSHKYGELLEDFGVPTWTPAPGEAVGPALARVLDDRIGQAQLGDRKRELVAKAEAMWVEVEATIARGGH